MALPKIVVFDLDNCVWWPEMYMMSGGPPFKFDRGRNVCLDRRGEEVCLLTDVRSIWNTLQTDPKFAGTKRLGPLDRAVARHPDCDR